jgi:hypothetical protein
MMSQYWWHGRSYCDFILIAGSIKDGTANVEYKQDSYWAVGQDGFALQ